MKPEGSHTFDGLLGAGLAFFFLRWFANSKRFGSAAQSRGFLAMVAVWLLVCWSILAAIWALEMASPQFNFPTLDSVCKTAMPLLDTTVREHVPASFGDCDNSATRPPQPCKGSKLLLNATNKHGFIEAVWLGGINTVSLENCRLWRSEPNTSSVGAPGAKRRYHLTIGGVFKEIRLFLDLKQCGPFGCTTMNSPDHCCGDGIKFHLTFGMDCRTGRGREAFTDVLIEDCDVDPMLVEQDFLGGALRVDALDISPMVEKVVRTQIEKFIGGTQLEWAGRRMHIPDLLNRLISYNAPGAAGSC